MDYSESYSKKEQNEIQSAYFGNVSFSLFTACCYLLHDNERISESVTVTSEASEKNRIAAFSCIAKVIRFAEIKYRKQFQEIHIWSDGCAAQFRSRFVFKILTTYNRQAKLFWHYNERHHGKGPMDGIGRTAKMLFSGR